MNSATNEASQAPFPVHVNHSLACDAQWAERVPDPAQVAPWTHYD